MGVVTPSRTHHQDNLLPTLTSGLLSTLNPKPQTRPRSPYAHPGLSQTLSIEDYYTQLFERTSFQFAPLGSADQISSGDGEHDDIISTRIKGAVPSKVSSEARISYFLDSW